MLTIENLEVSYGEIQALWGVSLEVHENEIVGILGPNGAGKTSTFQSIAGLVQPKKGKIIFNGQDITKIKGSDRTDLGIALVPEGRRLFPFMSVRDNLILGSYSKHAKIKRNETMEWVLDLFPILEERINQPARNLSGGEQQMLAISRALMSVPSLLILDEPSLGLAPKIVQDLFKIFKKINKEKNVTILISEQHVAMTLEIIDRAYVLEEGRIALSGNAKEIASNEHVKTSYLGL